MGRNVKRFYDIVCRIVRVCWRWCVGMLEYIGDVGVGGMMWFVGGWRCGVGGWK